MGNVVSLGSINVDRTRTGSEPELVEFARHDWFPDRDETVRIDRVPDALTADPDRIRHGGKGANQAVATASAGAEAAMLGKVGADHDEFGVLDALLTAGVDVDGVEVAPVPTGRADVFVGPGGDSWIVVQAGANGAVDRAYVEHQYETILRADCLLLQNEIPVEPVVALLSALADEPERPTVVLDPAPADGAERLIGCDAVDYLTPNEREYETLRPWLEGFDGVLVRTSSGDDVVVEGDQRFSVTPPRVTPVDTTGAGDVMNGFMTAQLAGGASLREAVETAVVAGALSTQTEGAREGIPTLEAIRSVRTASERARKP
jgi:ribokinase